MGLAAGAVLCAGSIIGLLIWLQLTPLRFDRFSVRAGDRVEEISRPGTYFVFEERAGASAPSPPPPYTIGVTSRGGDVVPVEQLISPNTEASPMPYRTPWTEGRAIARFTVDTPGAYHVRVVPLRRGSAAGYGLSTGGTLAIGQEVATTWIGSWPGVLVLAVTPLALGLTLIFVARRRYRRLAGPRDDLVPSGSVFTHG